MTITYLGHSGFTVRVGGRLLIFDALGGVEPTAEDRAVAFVSHAHADHFWPEVRRWRAAGQCALVTGEGVGEGICLKRGETAEADGVRVRAFGSTDEGVSFLAEAGGARIFHAGDFNFWSWREESTQAEVDEAEALFEDMLSEMRDMRPDVAFFPVDPRMKTAYDEGALRFAAAARPRLIIPMHFWNEPGAALAFARKPMPPGVSARAMVEKGGSIEWT
ncbi:MAG: MBL fold metallo-hydrolase [Clostridia bacterium]|nr:MBL fold metallo-hydrolase [Clostridia bacterium]